MAGRMDTPLIDLKVTLTKLKFPEESQIRSKFFRKHPHTQHNIIGYLTNIIWRQSFSCVFLLLICHVGRKEFTAFCRTRC